MINNNLIKDILNWQKSVFSDSTLNQYILKWEEEYIELEKTSNYKDWLNEWADLIIVTTGFLRFGKEGKILNKYFMELIILKTSFNDWSIGKDEFEIAVSEKLEINKKRKWKKINGTYHHI